MKSSKKVVIALLYHKGRSEVLSKVLNSVSNLEKDESNIGLILVNNNADELTEKVVNEWLNVHKKDFKEIVHVKLDGNVPLLRNFCLKKAMELKYDYIFFVDSDVILTRDSLKRLLNIFERNDSDRIFASSLPYFVPIDKDTLFVRVRTKYGKGSLAPLEQTKQPYVVPSTGMGATLINLSLIPKVGFFDEEIPYIEDLNLTRRATNAGYKIILDPSVQLFHDKKVGTIEWLKKTYELGEIEFKNMIKIGTWKSELRGIIYWSAYLFSLFLVVITPIPFILLSLIGYVRYVNKFNGIGKIIGFPILSVYKIVRTMGIIKGSVLYFFKKFF
ncbi:MAG: glycosyltransferase family 2 protein [Thaumarchaeota archaeon]|jgi:GT2 family glycosyltransferase|nr:glycosyltransferase family 2 protein [Nitrososphaerota archaeon]